VTNNWWPGEPLTRAGHQRKKYVEQNALILEARASRAFHEYMPLRFTQAEPGRVYRKISYGLSTPMRRTCSRCCAFAAVHESGCGTNAKCFHVRFVAALGA
jgi:PhoD-like phosphatase